MEIGFPVIKSASIFATNQYNIISEGSLFKPIVSKPFQQQNFYLIQKPIKKPPSASRFPSIVSHDVPSFSPVISDPLLKLQANRRTTSNTILPASIQNSVIKFSCKSRKGSLGGVPKETNQDNYIAHSSLQGVKGQYLFIVCDGHGSEGHLVSNLIKLQFVQVLERKLFRFPPVEALVRSIEEISEKVLHSRIDTYFSGSTLVSVLVICDWLVCANVGDSRAVLGKNYNGWSAIELSKDHKPDVKEEANRIYAANGRVSTHDQGGPLRIWFKDQKLPGLAMTRSIGDKASRKIGLISTPEVVERKLGSNDKFLIIASDGLWEFISSQEAVEIVANVWGQGKSEICCEKLLKSAIFQWNSKSMSVDDITVIVVFLNVKS